MTLIKKISGMLLIATLFTTNVFASDLLVDTTIDDAKGEAIGGWKYEVDRMDIQWTQDGQITVDIYTNFVDYNNEIGTSGSSRNIVLGDLLMSTNGDNTPYNYAFLLSDADRSQTRYYDQNHWDKTGNLSQISSTVTAKQYHNNSSSVQNGQVLAGNTVGAGRQSAWTVDRQNTGSSRTNFDKISFSFNVSGLDAFKNASQVAFSWAMSCANDVVEGVVDVNRPVSVPEPATFLLMLVGLGFIVNSRKNKSLTSNSESKFSA